MTLKEEIKAYDQRQLKLMLQILSDYKNKKTTFIGLGETLRSLITCLQKVDQAWKDKTSFLAGHLIGISDMMEYDNRIDKFVNHEEQKWIEETIKELIELIEPLIIKDDDDLI